MLTIQHNCEIRVFPYYTIVSFGFYTCMQCVKNVHEAVWACSVCVISGFRYPQEVAASLSN